MLINLSDVLSDQHKTVEETVRTGDGRDPVTIRNLPHYRARTPVHVKGRTYKGKRTAHHS